MDEIKQDVVPLEGEVHGLNQIQAMVLNVLTSSEAFVKAGYKTLSKTNISKFLSVPYSQVALVFRNKAFIDDLYVNSLANLHLNRGLVDKALIESASNNGYYHSQDRKLYYSLIGALQGDIRKPDSGSSDGMTRSEKEKQIIKYFKIFGKELQAGNNNQTGGHGGSDSGEGATPSSSGTPATAPPRSSGLQRRGMHRNVPMESD